MVVRAAFIVVAGVAAASASPPAIPRVRVTRPPFVEQSPTVVKYGAADVFGVTSGDLSSIVLAPSLVVSGINPDDRTLCFWIERSNGGYRASFDMRNPKLGRTVSFELPSAVLRRMRARAGELAARVRASEEATCDERDPLLVASWERAALSPISLLVYGDRANVVQIQQDKSQLHRCRALRTALNDLRLSTSSFDNVCPVSVQGRCGSSVELSLQSIEGRIYRDPKQVRVRVPCL